MYAPLEPQRQLRVAASEQPAERLHGLDARAPAPQRRTSYAATPLPRSAAGKRRATVRPLRVSVSRGRAGGVRSVQRNARRAVSPSAAATATSNAPGTANLCVPPTRRRFFCG